MARGKNSKDMCFFLISVNIFNHNKISTLVFHLWVVCLASKARNQHPRLKKDTKKTYETS